MEPRRARVPLFPYTTLFRSGQTLLLAQKKQRAIYQLVEIRPEAFLAQVAARSAMETDNPRIIAEHFLGTSIVSRNGGIFYPPRSEEHTSELQSRLHLVCLLL